jgi:lipoic acid synthetase
MKNRLPTWFRQDIPDATVRGRMQLLSEFNVNTVCQQAKCPNISTCFKNNRATFMILGDTCTRNCRFCNINKSGTVFMPKQNCPLKGDSLRFFPEPSPGVDLGEPFRIAEAVKRLRLNYVVITSVTRDDLEDGGAGQFAKVIASIRGINPDMKVEVLIPDFRGRIASIKCVTDAAPSVVAHNIETVSRLYGDLRPQADYQLSLIVLSKIKELLPDVNTKSSLMLGLGETKEEVLETLRDLRDNGCDILTLGQYLAPSVNHYPLKEFITIEQFQEYKEIGISMGFKVVLSGPLVRSSYQAADLYKELLYV